jgi:hypothetical protein
MRDTYLFRLKFQGRRIDAIAQSGGSRAVIEHMSEMSIALGTQDFRANHAVRHVAFFVDMTFP